LPHNGPVWAAAFSPSGRQLLTGSEDGHVRLFAVASGELIGKPMPQAGHSPHVAFSSDGRRR